MTTLEIQCLLIGIILGMQVTIIIIEYKRNKNSK